MNIRRVISQRGDRISNKNWEQTRACKKTSLQSSMIHQ
jgi:hypothetical protein